MLFPELKGNIPNFGELLAPSKDVGGVSFEKKSPRPHQKEAVKDLVNALSVSGSDVRTQGHMACGTGKTMVALWLAEKMQAKKTLLAEPSLALIAQNLKEWEANARGPRPEILVVCSDETVVKPNRDEIKVDLRDIPARVTNDPQEIARFLKNSSERKILMSTYHSLPLLGKAMETRGTGSFDLGIADEAHRTASKQDGAFTLFHYQEVIRSRSRLYLTATPKIYEGDNDLKISMDDESIFGKIGHSLPFSKAIELGLLADYRLVVATLPENYLGKGKKYETPEMQDTIKQLAVLKAIEKYHLSKVLTFHSSVKRAYGFAESLEINGPKFLPNREIFANGVDGTMSTKTRSELLKLLAERPKKVLSLLSNCRCLTEGIDVQAIDGVVFYDKKNDEIDIVQAIGRAIRQSTSTNKEYGTIIVPLIVPSNVESAEFLQSSEFRKIAQVMGALRAHDDRFEVRLRAELLSTQKSEVRRNRASTTVHFNLQEIPEDLRESLSTKVLRIGAGVKKDVLTEELILDSAREFHKIYGRLPSASSPEPVPGMPNETWSSINSAGNDGYRNIQKGRTLTVILELLRRELGISEVKKVNTPVTVESIKEAVKIYYMEHKKLPLVKSKEELSGLPGVTWSRLNDSLRGGYSSIKEYKKLMEIIQEAANELEKDGIIRDSLNKSLIIKAIKEYYRLHKKFPSKISPELVPGISEHSWSTLNSSLYAGQNGFERGASLAKETAKLKAQLKVFVRGRPLTEDLIVNCAREFYKTHGFLPTRKTKEPVPGIPGEKWRAIDEAGYKGQRSLTEGRRLSLILEPLKEELGLLMSEQAT